MLLISGNLQAPKNADNLHDYYTNILEIAIAESAYRMYVSYMQEKQSDYRSSIAVRRSTARLLPGISEALKEQGIRGDADSIIRRLLLQERKRLRRSGISFPDEISAHEPRA